MDWRIYRSAFPWGIDNDYDVLFQVLSKSFRLTISVLKRLYFNAANLNFKKSEVYVHSMNIFLLCFLLVIPAFASFDQIDQYPEDRTYTSQDRGIGPYNTKSIYKTGTFVLTFDDGPHPTRTPMVLDTLKKYNKKAIFFILTSHVNDSNIHIVKRILDEGHLIGSHSPSHDRSTDLTREEYKRQTKQSFLDLAKFHKRAGHELTKPYYRFPYGAYGSAAYHHINVLKEVSVELMGDNCINMAFWDIDSSDWVPGMTAKDVAQNMIAFNEGGTYFDFKLVNGKYVKVSVQIKNPTAGGVILQHDVQAASAEGGLELFLQYAEQRGLNIPRIDEVEEFKITKNCKL